MMNRKEQIAKEISQVIPTFIRHMYPYVFEPMEVPPSQILALVAIEENNGCTLSQLKREMHVSAPTISGIVERLVRDGFITRTEDRNDRRIKNVVLTKNGQMVLEKFRKNIKERWQQILNKVPVETAKSIIINLSKITEGFKNGSI